jgi:hypothetical protein
MGAGIVKHGSVLRVTAHWDPVKLAELTKRVPSSSSSSGAPTPGNHSQTSDTGNQHASLIAGPAQGASSATTVRVPSTVATSAAPPTFAAQMDSNMVHTMCQYQMQIFSAFMENAKRRLDRWNMRVVMSASYYLLHLYVQEYGVADVHAAALVVACIYLAGKVSAVLSFVVLFTGVGPCRGILQCQRIPYLLFHFLYS